MRAVGPFPSRLCALPPTCLVFERDAVESPRPVFSSVICLPVSVVRACRNWQRKQDHAFTQWLNMVLGESYKESNGSQEAAVNRTVLLRCRHQLGQLRENDETIVHALNQVL